MRLEDLGISPIRSEVVTARERIDEILDLAEQLKLEHNKTTARIRKYRRFGESEDDAEFRKHLALAIRALHGAKVYTSKCSIGKP